MTGGAAQVDQPAFGQDGDALPVGIDHLVHLGLDVHLFEGLVLKDAGHFDLRVEMADVADDGLVLHAVHVLPADGAEASSGGDENFADGGGMVHGHHLEALHGRLQGADGVDLGHQHAGAHAAEGLGAALAHLAITGHDADLAGHHHVRGPLDAVQQGFADAVEVVELALGDRIVDVDGGHLEHAFFLPLIQPVHPGGGLLGQAADIRQHFRVLLVHHRGQVAAVVQQQVGAFAAGPFQGLLDAPPVFLIALALPGEHRRALHRQRGGRVILGGKNIARTPAHLRAQVLQGFHQHGGLDGHVDASGDAGAAEGLLSGIFFPQRHQSRHFRFGNFRFLAAPFGQVDVGNLVIAHK